MESSLKHIKKSIKKRRGEEGERKVKLSTMMGWSLLNMFSAVDCLLISALVAVSLCFYFWELLRRKPYCNHYVHSVFLER